MDKAMKKAPAFLKKYFWDIDFDRLDVSKRSTYVIERILELGDMPSIKWMLKEYPLPTIKGVLIKTSVLSKKTASFWALILDVPISKIRCLQSDFQKTHRAIWPY